MLDTPRLETPGLNRSVRDDARADGSRADEPMLEVVGVTHRYGNHTALADVSLTAGKGEFLTILGSSGSGKTTMLRVISGLETPRRVKRLRINGVDVAALPPARRSCTTVFQSYALFPHMSVVENVAYGLRIRKVNAVDADKEARRALAMVQLEAKATRNIAQLSGGERQRVALARAVVTRPSVLLLDEPLGALDEKLRQDMQLELMELQRSLGMTFIYITHSQEEALTMSDRVVLMHLGRIVQSGRPLELFDHPVSRFAAEFMGYENILPATYMGRQEGLGVVKLEEGSLLVKGEMANPDLAVGSPVELAIRAERITQGKAQAENSLPASLLHRVYRGKYTDVTVNTPAGAVKLRSWDGMPSVDEIAHIGWHSKDAIILSPQTDNP